MTSFPQAAVLGHPIGHSRSPLIHRHWLQRYGIEGDYIRLDVEPADLERTLDFLLQVGFRGANITIPHKVSALSLSDEVTERARSIGAANTLIFRDGRILADNTDGYGFMANLTQTVPDWNATGGPALVIGAGGAARAVIDALVRAGVPQVIVANRSIEKAEALRDCFGMKVEPIGLSAVDDHLADIELLVNTTSLGMNGQPPLPVDLKYLNDTATVSDLVYDPQETSLLKVARARGNKIVGGIGMLLHQAAPGFEAWFGRRPEIDDILMNAVLE